MRTIDRGLFSYLVSGTREDEAAEWLEAKIDWIDRQTYYPYDRTDDIILAVQKAQETFGVTIRSSVGGRED